MTVKPYRTRVEDVPLVKGLKEEDGWYDMQVRFCVDKATVGTDNVLGWTVLPAGAAAVVLLLALLARPVRAAA